jgi:hypothetical protein
MNRHLRFIQAGLLCLALAIAGCQKISTPVTLTSRPADISAIGGNGEPILGEGFTGLSARCTPLTVESSTYLDVVAQETEEGKQALLFIGLGLEMQMVDPFPITRTDTATTRVYTGSFFTLTVTLDNALMVGGKYPGRVEMTLNGVLQTRDLY